MARLASPGKPLGPVRPHPFAQVDAHEAVLRPGIGIGARQHQQLLAQADHAVADRLDALGPRAHPAAAAPASARTQPQAGQRRAQLMGRMADEAPRAASEASRRSRSLCVRPAARSRRHAGHFQRLHVVDGTLADLSDRWFTERRPERTPCTTTQVNITISTICPSTISQRKSSSIHIDISILCVITQVAIRSSRTSSRMGGISRMTRCRARERRGAADARPERRRREECVPASWPGALRVGGGMVAAGAGDRKRPSGRSTSSI